MQIDSKQHVVGNLFVKVSIKNIDSRFEIRGNDVYTTQDISLSKVLLGGMQTFETLHGKVEKDIPK